MILSQQTIWFSPTGYVTGDPSLRISFPSVSHPHTIVASMAKGDLKWISLGLPLPQGVQIEEITLCYQVSDPRSFISQVRLSEMATPDQVLVRHDDATDLTSTSPARYTSLVSAVVTSAALTLDLRLNFQNTNDQILLGAVGVTFRPMTECVTTIADLKALKADVARCLTVLGYHIPGDGGGGSFYWDAATSEAENGGTVIVPDSSPLTGRWKRMVKDPLSVKWFGAKGDGINNDTPAFEAAIELSRTARLPLEIPAGTYLVDTIYAIQDYAWLRGAGIQKTILKSRCGGDVLSKRTLRSAITIVIEDLSIEGFGQAGNNGHGIAIPPDVNDTGSVTIRNVEIAKCGGSGLRFFNTFHLLLEAVQISECGDHLFNLEGGNTTTLIRCYGRHVATGKAAYRIKSGRPVFIACNGIDGGTNADWGVFGANLAEDGTTHYCTPTFLGCNMEDFTHRGCYFKEGSFGNFLGATFVAPANSTLVVKALEYGHLGGSLPILDASSYIVSNGASWLSNSPVHALGAPFLNLGATLGGHIPIETIFNPSDSQTWQTPLATAYYAGSRKFALQLNQAALDNVQIGKVLPCCGDAITAHKTGTTSWEPPVIENGATASTTVTVSNAAIGDTVAVGFSTPVPAGALLAGVVTAPDTVTVTLVNLTGAPLNLASGLLRSDVWKH